MDDYEGEDFKKVKEYAGRMPMCGRTAWRYYCNALLDEMDKRGLKQMLNTKVLEFTEEGILAESEGRVRLIPADSCVYSIGMKADQAAVEVIQEMAGNIRTYVVGDCGKAGKVGDAVHGGYKAAIDIV